jgi:hypothetical protein
VSEPLDDDELLPSPPKIGQQETVMAFLTGSKRIGAAVPIRSTFVQKGRRGQREPGPLSDFVTARDEIALDLLLLTLAAASAPPHDVMRPSDVWLRALGRNPRSKSSASVLSRAWKRLEERHLIKRGRQGRLLRIELQREDGSEEPYTYPTGTSSDLYFKLPFAYWTEGLQNTLTLRGKAMFLVALSLPDGFTLPYERVPGWYGISADTAQRGLRELQATGHLDVLTGYRAAPLTAQGWTEERQYSLEPRWRVPAVKARQAVRAAKSPAPKRAVPRKAAKPTQSSAKGTRSTSSSGRKRATKKRGSI